MDIALEVGKKIKYYRKQRNMRIQDLAGAIYKSSATVSKYENGLISIDVATLYDISRVLNVNPDDFLVHEPITSNSTIDLCIPQFFRGANRLYMYLFDGRVKKLRKSVIDIIGQIDSNSFEVILYVGIYGYDTYKSCEATFIGTMHHHDAISNITLENRDTKMEKYMISIPDSYLNTPTKWALAFGISTRPIMPTATKVLITKEIQTDEDSLIKELKISKEDIKLLKQNNMLSII